MFLNRLVPMAPDWRLPLEWTTTAIFWWSMRSDHWFRTFRLLPVFWWDHRDEERMWSWEVSNLRSCMFRYLLIANIIFVWSITLYMYVLVLIFLSFEKGLIHHTTHMVLTSHTDSGPLGLTSLERNLERTRLEILLLFSASLHFESQNS